MELENVRLLIVVENFDLELLAQPSEVETNVAKSRGTEQAGLPTKLSPSSVAEAGEADLEGSRAVDLHILQSATYWRSHLQEVAIYAACSPSAYSQLSDSGVRLMGSGLSSQAQSSQAQSSQAQSSQPQPEAAQPQPDERSKIRAIADYCPTHLAICTPDASIISWATHNKISSVVLLCSWREPLGWRQRWQHQQLIKQLNQPCVSWVGTHGAYACEILRASGIEPQKLIPWEWPQPHLPFQDEPRQLRYDRDTIKLLYVGPIHKTAGVDTLLHAVHHLHQRNRIAHLQLICETSDEKAAHGDLPLPEPTEKDSLHQPSNSLSRTASGYPSAGYSSADYSSADYAASLSASKAQSESRSVLSDATQEDVILGEAPLKKSAASRDADALDRDLRRLKALVKTLELTAYVTFTPALAESKRSDAKLLRDMRATDLVVMPGYDRNWPAAVPPSLQFAMATRTPVIAADHNHFKEHLFHGVNAMIFPEGNPKSMAHRIERVMSQPQLYAQLSEAINIPLHAIKVPARWADLINRWLQSGEAPPIGTRNYQQLCNWAFSSGRYQGITPMQKPPESLAHHKDQGKRK